MKAKWVLFGLLVSSFTVSASEPVIYSLSFQRKFGKLTSSIEVECEKAARDGGEEACFIKKVKGSEVVFTGKVSSKTVVPTVKSFFGRIPASEVGSDAAVVEFPNDAVVSWVVTANGKKNFGWVTGQEFGGSLIHKRAILDQVLSLETQLSNLAR